MDRTEPRAGIKPHLWLVAKLIFWGLLIYFCLKFFIPRWEALQVSRRLETMAVGWLVAAGVVTLLHYLSVLGLWTLLLRVLGARPAPLLVFRAFVLSLLPKYLPGKVLAYGARTQLARQAGVPMSVATASIIWEGMLGLGSVALVSLLGLLYRPPVPLRQAFAWVMLAFGAGAAVLAAAGLVSSRWRAWTGLPQLAQRWPALAGLFGLYAGTWFISGIGHWCLAQALSPLPAGTLLPLVSGVALSWGLGVVSVIAPAGLGVREGVLYLFVRDWMGEGDALLFVTLSRLVMFAVELLLTGAWWLYSLRSPRVAEAQRP